MKLERLHESLLPVMVIISGLGLAIASGSMIASAQFGAVAVLLVAIVTIAFFLVARERIWILIPALWLLGGKVSVLPLPFSIRQLGVLFALTGFLLLKAFKVIRLKPKVDFLDVWVWVVLLYLLTVFLRNPVGVEALGSSKVGGKPYFDVFTGFASYWVLSRAVATRRQAFWLPLMMVGVAFFEFTLNVIARVFPSTAFPLTQLYSGISALESGEVEVMDPSGPISRQAYMYNLGSYGALAVFSYWRPFTVINPINFWRFLGFLFASYAILISGFRSAIASMVATFFISSYFRRGIGEVCRAAGIAFSALTLLVLLQGTVINLPIPAQRALSFLPGNWDYSAKNEAAGSTEWRVTMWKQMLIGDKYIDNKWLGDGFGFTRQQLNMMNANTLTGDNSIQQENLLISGGVHSGPVGAIRFVGYVGLAMFIVLLVLIAIRAWKLIRRCENTPFYSLALFLGVPAVWFPINFIFIFGAYGEDLTGMLMTVGMLKLLENSLAAEARENEKPPTIIPQAKVKERRQFAAPRQIG